MVNRWDLNRTAKRTGHWVWAWARATRGNLILQAVRQTKSFDMFGEMARKQLIKLIGLLVVGWTKCHYKYTYEGTGGDGEQSARLTQSQTKTEPQTKRMCAADIQWTRRRMGRTGERDRERERGVKVADAKTIFRVGRSSWWTDRPWK